MNLGPLEGKPEHLILSQLSSRVYPWIESVRCCVLILSCFSLIKLYKPGMVVHAYNPSTWEVEAGGRSVEDQPELQETLSQTK